MVPKKTPDQIRLRRRQDQHFRHLRAVEEVVRGASFGDPFELYPQEAPYRHRHSPGDPWWQQFSSRWLNKRELAKDRAKRDATGTALVPLSLLHETMSHHWRLIKRCRIQSG